MKHKSPGKQLTIDDFRSSLCQLPKSNCWVMLGDNLPWEAIEKLYNSKLNNRHTGAGNKSACMFVSSLITKNIETKKALVFDPGYIQKAGKKTPGVGYFWSGCASNVKRELEFCGLAVLGLTRSTVFHLFGFQTIKADPLLRHLLKA